MRTVLLSGGEVLRRPGALQGGQARKRLLPGRTLAVLRYAQGLHRRARAARPPAVLRQYRDEGRTSLRAAWQHGPPYVQPLALTRQHCYGGICV